MGSQRQGHTARTLAKGHAEAAPIGVADVIADKSSVIKAASLTDFPPEWAALVRALRIAAARFELKTQVRRDGDPFHTLVGETERSHPHSAVRHSRVTPGANRNHSETRGVSQDRMRQHAQVASHARPTLVADLRPRSGCRRPPPWPEAGDRVEQSFHTCDAFDCFKRDEDSAPQDAANPSVRAAAAQAGGFYGWS